MTLEGAKLLELHSSVSVASGMSHHEYNQTAVSYSSKFLTKQKQIQVWQLQYLIVIIIIMVIFKCYFSGELIALS